MSTTDARQRNMQSIEKIDTTDLGGGVMPRDLFDQFYQEVQESAELLDLVRTETLGRQQEAIPKIGVDERQMEAVGEDETGTFRGANTGAVELDVVKTAIYWELTSEAVEDTVDNVADILLNKFQQQFAADVQDLGINGEGAAGTGFEAINQGWVHMAQNGDDENSDRLGNDTMPSYDHAGGGVNTALFDEAIQTLEGRYRDDDFVFLMSKDNVQEYKAFLTDRETGLGDAVLFGDSDLTPFSYPVIGVSNWDDDETAMFTDPQNLIWALRRDVEIDVIDESDEVLERDLFARYALRARHDYQIEDMQKGVVIENIQTA